MTQIYYSGKTYRCDEKFSLRQNFTIVMEIHYYYDILILWFEFCNLNSNSILKINFLINVVLENDYFDEKNHCDEKAFCRGKYGDENLLL